MIGAVGWPGRLAWEPGLRVVGPLAALLAVAVSLVLATLLWIAREQDRHAAEASARLAAGVVRAAGDALARVLPDYAVWNEAHDNLVRRFDSAWADDNFGA